MANLRANNLTGTGGRNALDGSVAFLGSKDALQVPAGSDFAYGTGDFTIETWIRPGGGASGTSKGIFCQTQSGNDYVKFFIESDTTIKATFGSDTITGGKVEVASWSHVAVTRASNTVKVFVNGVASSGTSVTTDFTDTTRKPTIGQYTHSFGTLEYYGYISNFHIVKGTALYTTDFTPSTEKLTAVDGTVLLCCQDSDDPTQEATGKTITGYGNLNKVTDDVELITNGQFFSDVSGWTVTQGAFQWTAGQAEITSPATTISQNITTVVGKRYRIEGTANDTANTSNNVGMTLGSRQVYLPSDSFRPAAYTFTGYFTATSTTTTAQFWGGTDALGKWSNISVKLAESPKQSSNSLPPVGVDEGVTFEGETKVNTQGHMYFPTGDTSQRGRGRGLFGSGISPAGTNLIAYIQIQSTGNSTDFGDLTRAATLLATCSSSTRGLWGGDYPSAANTIDYVTIATTANAVDFGDLTDARYNFSGCGSETRGLFGGGHDPSVIDVIDYVTIASTGNATDFGNLLAGCNGVSSASSPTRGLWFGGDTGSKQNVIQYVTIATTGNATDFGDMQETKHNTGALSSQTRALVAGGNTGSIVDTIDYVEIATTGNGVDFGNLTAARQGAGTASNSRRGVFASGLTPSSTNTMDYVTIETTGNATDYGDLDSTITHFPEGLSDSHGGLS